MKSLEKIDPMIPQTNPAALVEKMRPEIDEAIKRVLGSGRYILGSEVEEFEKEWAEWCGVEDAVGCANGTDGLELILRSINIPRDSRVLAPSHTAVATISAIVRAGFRPYFADVDSGTFTLDQQSVERCLKDAEKTNDPIKAIIAVHLYGQPCKLDELEELCKRHGVILIEDGSQAHGARWKGKRVGGFGVAAAFSLYPTKNLGALGDAGVVTTNDRDIAQRMREIRQYGWRERAISEEPGLNSRLDPIQAAVLRVKLPMLEAHNAHRKEIAAVYRKEFNNANLLEMLPVTDISAEHVYHQFVVKLPAGWREDIQTRLIEMGVGTLVHYPKAAHQMPAYRNKEWVGKDPTGLKNTEEFLPRILSLPIGTHMSVGQAKQVAERLVHALSERQQS